MDGLRRLRDTLGALRPAGDANLARIRRRKAMVSAIGRRVNFLRLVLFLIGYVWILAIPFPNLGRGVYFDENALQPGQVNTYWSWQDVHNADRYLERLEQLRDSNATSEQRSEYLVNEFRKVGLPASLQQYEFSGTLQGLKGINAYAVLSSPRTSGAEAMVISASWRSRTNEGDGTLNLRGVATVLALSKFLKNYSLWAKDLIFIVSDGYLDGMQAWLQEYHGSSQSNLQAQRLELTSGVIWTALNIDYPGHSLSHLGIFHEGLNGRLPNQDLLNSFQHISRRSGVQVVLYDNTDERLQLPSWLPAAIQDIPEVRTYASQARNVLRHVGYQASGRGSGVHALFHQFRIDAFTVFAVPATGPHGFHALGRIVESTLRTMNNLLERLHASFFFYVLTAHDRFIKIGNYLPSVVLISIAMMFGGLRAWVDAAWILEQDNKDPATKKWAKRKRPVIPVLAIMISTHFLGLITFLTLTSSWCSNHIIGRLILCVIAYTGPLVLSIGIASSSHAGSLTSLALVLKALNLCFTSTVISIMTVLNFSLAACLAVFLGIPLSISSASSKFVARIVKYTLYFLLGFGWIFMDEKVRSAIWDWDIVGVWSLPLVCIVYAPLVLQAGLVCLL